jgi:hypothetical protein
VVTIAIQLYTVAAGIDECIYKYCAILILDAFLMLSFGTFAGGIINIFSNEMLSKGLYDVSTTTSLGMSIATLFFCLLGW